MGNYTVIMLMNQEYVILYNSSNILTPIDRSAKFNLSPKR